MITAATISIDELRPLARSLGIDLVGICNLTQVRSHQLRVAEWQDAGHAGEMKYMQRSPELLTGSDHLFPEMRSVISCSIAYSQGSHPERASGEGRIARYAWGKDYHLVLPELLRKLVSALEVELGRTIKSRIFTDALPFLERAGAHSAGLGFVGKNTMLIRKGIGSLFFIAEIFWDLEVEGSPSAAEANSCGSCTNCLDSCPTGAFVAPFTLSAPRCISYLTIEKRGAHTVEERRALGEWVFGCDICQDVCPFNHRTIKYPSLRQIESFSPAVGAGPLLDLGSMLRVKSNREFEERFLGTPLLRPGKNGLQRNALAVAVNTGAEQLGGDAIYLAENSESPVVRRTALWAVKKFGLAKEFGRIRERHLRDPDPEVRAEAAG